MKIFAAATIAGCIAILGSITAPIASASEWDRKTTMTFSGPVEIPGVHLKGWGVLPAGTYVFKIVDSSSDRHIVQIFSADERTVYATILAIPNYRLKATDKTVVTFRERPAGQPEALRAWFYPGRNWGEEFVYPKSKAVTLAQETNTPVLYTTSELPVEVEEPARLAEAPVMEEMRREPVRAIRPSGDEVLLAQVVTPPPPSEMRITEDVLPKTASDLPLFALLGFLALAIASGSSLLIRRAEKRA